METKKLKSIYFESSSMKELYKIIQEWENENNNSLYSINIKKDNNLFCCIALIGNIEVIIVDKEKNNYLKISDSGRLSNNSYHAF